MQTTGREAQTPSTAPKSGTEYSQTFKEIPNGRRKTSNLSSRGRSRQVHGEEPEYQFESCFLLRGTSDLVPWFVRQGTSTAYCTDP